MTRLILTAIGLTLTLTATCGPARASEPRRPGTTQTPPEPANAQPARATGPSRAITVAALDALCGPGHRDLAGPVDAAARRYMLHPVTIVALVKSESPRCDPNAVNPRTGATGLTQILPTGSANPRHLSVESLKDPATNLDLGARHLAGLLVLCGSLGGAVHVYHGHRTCGGWQRDEHAWKVLGYVARFWREIARRGAPRS